MLNTVYQLVAPRKFEVTYENIGLQDDDIIVRPTHLSICNADQRYYQGLREEHVLRQKLPMALIHEGIGVVLRDPSGEFEPGEEVVMIPNTPVEEDEILRRTIFAQVNSVPADLMDLCRNMLKSARTD